MPVVLDTCALADHTSQRERKTELDRILRDNVAYISSSCAVEALFLTRKFESVERYERLLEHFTRGEDVRIVDERDPKILDMAVQIYGLGACIESCMTAAIAAVNNCPVVTAKLAQNSEPDDYVEIERRGYCVVWRI